MVSDERALATWLAARDDVALAATLAARGIAPTAPWHDFFDAAEALLDPASIDRALTRLPRHALVALRSGAPEPGELVTRCGFAGPDGSVFSAVAALIDRHAAERPEAFADVDVPASPVADDRQTAAAAERAFTTAGALADVLLAASHAPLGRTGLGSVVAPDRKRLVDTGAVQTADDLEDLLRAAEGAGLARADDRAWVLTAAGDRWLRRPTSERWAVVAEGIREMIPAAVRGPHGEAPPPQAWPTAFPLDPDWPVAAARLLRLSERWGLIDPDGAQPAWTAPLWSGERADPAALAAHLPAEIDRVFLQADLTAIAPGPLAPALDLRLRGVALRESRAQASTYRFTADSITAALAEGETAGSILEFLGGLSLTGIPQPLQYLVETTAARHGLVRVRIDASGRTSIDSPDAGLLDTIAVDQALRPLGLIPGGGVLTSRVPRDAVYWSLADARYPVIALDDDGAPEPMHRRAAAAPSAPAAGPAAYERLIQAMRSGHDAGGDGGWLERELDQAVRSRSEIVVVVRMPDGSERSLTLEAAGLGGGRLRGRDRAADIERTLPVSSIVSVRPV